MSGPSPLPSPSDSSVLRGAAELVRFAAACVGQLASNSASVLVLYLLDGVRPGDEGALEPLVDVFCLQRAVIRFAYRLAIPIWSQEHQSWSVALNPEAKGQLTAPHKLPVTLKHPEVVVDVDSGQAHHWWQLLGKRLPFGCEFFAWLRPVVIKQQQPYIGAVLDELVVILCRDRGCQ
eukprot:scaffold26098_cov32-Tisochrysis_lutea.AAC.5